MLDTAHFKISHASTFGEKNVARLENNLNPEINTNILKFPFLIAFNFKWYEKGKTRFFKEIFSNHIIFFH